MNMLRSTMVDAAFRPAGEEPRNLLDFVDEQGVEKMRDGLKELIDESKVTKSFKTIRVFAMLTLDSRKRKQHSVHPYFLLTAIYAV